MPKNIPTHRIRIWIHHIVYNTLASTLHSLNKTPRVQKFCGSLLLFFANSNLITLFVNLR
jgi:hypothetical protein